MRTQLDVYAVTRNYLLDNAGILSQSELLIIHGMLRGRNFQKLASITSDHRFSKNTAVRLKVLMQIEAFFKKNADFAEEKTCYDAAYTSFMRGETLCRITNRRLDHYYTRSDRLDPEFLFLVNKARTFIANVLGDFNQFKEDIPSLLKVTSGATFALSRRDALPPARLRRRMDVTPRCKPYLSALYRSFGYRAPGYETTLWNRLEFVPKSWKTHRTIACEPTGNVPFQLAFDTYVKKQLRPVGINLSSQTGNQRHALEGSIDGSLCTVDLSMASDTVSFNTVAWLLPEPWFQYLDDVRSPGYKLGDQMQMYSKFSSMGNGGTFALETLIFASLVRAAGSKKGLVYGDDITIEPEYFPNLAKLLKFFGFLINTDKSFTSGPFRESCGKHYYEGVDVTPFFIRTTDVWDRPNTCHNVNGLRGSSEYGHLWEYLRTYIGSERLPWVVVSDDTTSGVHIHPKYAYQLNLIRDLGVVRSGGNKGCTPNGILATRTYIRKNVIRKYFDTRGYALWHLRALARNEESIEPLITSRYTASSHKYVRKWVAWHMPSTGVPEELFGFSAYLSAIADS